VAGVICDMHQEEAAVPGSVLTGPYRRRPIGRDGVPAEHASRLTEPVRAGITVSCLDFGAAPRTVLTQSATGADGGDRND
jgi:hypothetical protein